MADDLERLGPMTQLQIAIRMLQGTHVDLRAELEAACHEHPALRWRPPVPAEVDVEVLVADDGAITYTLADDGALSIDEAAAEEEQQAAAWLVRAVERRRASMARLIERLVVHQAPFLRGEAAEPEALERAALAAELGFHESTVERLLQRKRLRIRPAGGEPREVELAGLA
ncbi:MAG: hypothetical protein KC486_13520 [Myxococcales bacterium]|nr:hypothetical protein [Myxococcales bacterium]